MHVWFGARPVGSSWPVITLERCAASAVFGPAGEPGGRVGRIRKDARLLFACVRACVWARASHSCMWLCFLALSWGAIAASAWGRKWVSEFLHSSSEPSRHGCVLIHIHFSTSSFFWGGGRGLKLQRGLVPQALYCIWICLGIKCVSEIIQLCFFLSKRS